MAEKVTKDLQRRIVRLLDGELSGPEADELERELIRSPSGNRLLREYERQDHLVSDALAGVLSPLSAEEHPPAPAARPQRPSARPWTAAAAAAAAAMLATGLWFGLGPDGPAGAPPGERVSGGAGQSLTEASAADRWVPPAEAEFPARRVRRIDRFSFDVFDEQGNEFRRLYVDREQTQIRLTSMDL